MPTSPVDDIANPPLRAWDDVDRSLVAEARELARMRLIPETTAYVLHGGRHDAAHPDTSLCAADAEQIGAALAHMIHGLQPDRVLVTHPGTASVAPVPDVGAIQAMASERGGAWRHVQLPLPYVHPHAGIGVTTVTSPDPWTAHVRWCSTMPRHRRLTCRRSTTSTRSSSSP